MVLNTKFALEPYSVLNLCEFPYVHSLNQLWGQEQPHGRKVTNSTGYNPCKTRVSYNWPTDKNPIMKFVGGVNVGDVRGGEWIGFWLDQRVEVSRLNA